MRSSGILRSIEWSYRTEVSGLLVGRIFKFLTLEDETDRLSQNVGTE
jgi:hypothetical protein